MDETLKQQFLTKSTEKKFQSVPIDTDIDDLDPGDNTVSCPGRKVKKFWDRPIDGFKVITS